MFDSQVNQQIIFPDNVTVIITKIMEKNGFKETADDIIQKLKNREKPIGQKISKIIAQRAMEEISAKDTPSLISKTLNISDEIAKNLANDIEKEIIIFVKKVPIEKETPEEKEIIKKPGVEGIHTKEKFKTDDAYRETVTEDLKNRESQEESFQKKGVKKFDKSQKIPSKINQKRDDAYREPLE